MTIVIGYLSLGLTVLAAALIVVLSLAAVRFRSSELHRASARGIHGLTILLSVAAAALMTAMVSSDFRLAYVTQYTERALPLGYKMAAFWAGQAGSLLLWAWLLAVISSIFVIWHRRDSAPQYTIANAVLAVCIGFFATLMLFAEANPFEANAMVPVDGQGLNPMLQDPAMLAHPPILFVGYAGFAVPFALLLGALIARRDDGQWALEARPWAMIAWAFLGVGILWGAKWAYVELGWGGYWAWDPVENASLLPWLTGTALLHSIVGQRQRGMLKRWAAVLAAMTFILCIFGTYITRSGVVASVHSFGASVVGTMFLMFLMVCTAVSTVLIVVRWDTMRPDAPLNALISREAALALTNILLVAMMLVTLVGTMFPAITQAVTGRSIGVEQGYYNTLVLPMALALAALMALAPLLRYGQDAAGKLLRSAWAPAAAAVLVMLVIWILGIRSVWVLAATAVAVMLLGAIVVDLVQTIATRPTALGVLRMLDANHRRYGAQIVHAGIAMIVVGVAGSSIYGRQSLLQFAPSQTHTVGGYSLTLDGFDEVRQAHFTAVEATITVTSAGGRTQTLHPQRRFYDKHEQANSEVAILGSWREDLYVSLAGWDRGGEVVTLQVMVNPLVRWIWAGGVVLSLGALLSLLPPFVVRPVVAVQTPAAGGKSRRRQPQPVPV